MLARELKFSLIPPWRKWNGIQALARLSTLIGNISIFLIFCHSRYTNSDQRTEHYDSLALEQISWMPAIHLKIESFRYIVTIKK